ncbi:MAG: copper amine oxidase N-terminal domain-containing protein [Symbiobacteriaceae bacterium]|nr:copper amine oxidase N-terminal domain-containing protein [Symbiobacteriaceae bacterium]
MSKFLGLVMVLLMVFGTVTSAAELPVTEKTDRFDVIETDSGLSLISQDGELVIHISDKTAIHFEDGLAAAELMVEGQTLAELLNGRKLTVRYTITTRSLPPQTTPSEVIIHYETPVAPIYQFTPGELDALLASTSSEEKIDAPVAIAPPIYTFSPEEIVALFPLNGEIVVGDTIITAPLPYYNNGVVMVPLRAVAEALGFTVAWEHETQSLRLGVAINLRIGADYYTVGRMAPIELGTTPELCEDGNTFVPLSFFQKVISGYQTYVFEGQVVITAANDMR